MPPAVPRHQFARGLKVFFLFLLACDAFLGWQFGDSAQTTDLGSVPIYSAVFLGVASLVILPYLTNHHTTVRGYTRGAMIVALLLYQLMGTCGLVLSWLSRDPLYASIFCGVAIFLTALTPPAYHS